MKLNVKYTVGWDGEADKCKPIVREINIPIHKDNNFLVIRFPVETLEDIVDLMNKCGLKATLENN